ncbi:ribosomal-protein-alanine N-acetyltransferase [candidate division WOR-1 bacterium RIFOXYA12_FULL_43_27]|uniref:[Ribosomal protein bS18]-alanine N-acetyltransferase n=1 Tax=candidate division WOR-1 bacterium RIFOXYC2_FULL_46_14 TaxID=1802587 RepID=A0A1F4U342_UNCSA|nr:MAG: ribosomal-protein-alanine N-acetyltransferase [candidate division WOR-1 bacterium RIFOXYA12_FULL_43_27]OGC18892.1 MAG: ribosomal-protein-alanine N-acetyltransferase [candidate division WOR-1 bacterium RIFOXYB2_FULL_46_45]OGC29033.1 MAG: ribosomal-protein-alanine N-acetyltransferase [candidate division WOR-1 bacterium RIFOXYA2_FULL_46_56]OGC39287.1 MAG: ribosomal-protein-alanine N-acetyltransferase [candidate division WOR-1 bacterium RIFOXYC2_FULL_46_14]
MIKIFLLTEKELPEVIAIENLSFPFPWKPEQFSKNLPQFYCAKIDDKVVGFIGIEKIHDEAHILHMAVDPAFRRQGIGKLMLEEALKTDASKFILEVRESNSPARSLYESFGFKEAYRRKKYYNDNDEDALVMIYEKKPA